MNAHPNVLSPAALAANLQIVPPADLVAGRKYYILDSGSDGSIRDWFYGAFDGMEERVVGGNQVRLAMFNVEERMNLNEDSVVNNNSNNNSVAEGPHWVEEEGGQGKSFKEANIKSFVPSEYDDGIFIFQRVQNGGRKRRQTRRRKTHRRSRKALRRSRKAGHR